MLERSATSMVRWPPACPRGVPAAVWAEALAAVDAEGDRYEERLRAALAQADVGGEAHDDEG